MSCRRIYRNAWSRTRWVSRSAQYENTIPWEIRARSCTKASIRSIRETKLVWRRISACSERGSERAVMDLARNAACVRLPPTQMAEGERPEIRILQSFLFKPAMNRPSVNKECLSPLSAYHFFASAIFKAVLFVCVLLSWRSSRFSSWASSPGLVPFSANSDRSKLSSFSESMRPSSWFF